VSILQLSKKRRMSLGQPLKGNAVAEGIDQIQQQAQNQSDGNLKEESSEMISH